MCRNILYPVFLFLLLSGKPLQAQDINQMQTDTALSLPDIVQHLKQNNVDLIIQSNFYKKNYLIVNESLKSQIRRSETLDLRVTELTQSQEIMKSSCENSINNCNLAIAEKDKDISHYKWSRAEFTVGAFILGLIVGVLFFN